MKLKILFSIFVVFAISFTACENADDTYHGVYIIGAEKADPSVSISIDDQLVYPYPALGIVIASTIKAEGDCKVNIAADSDALERYNKAYGTNYSIFPESNYELSSYSAVIRGGEAAAEGIRLSISSREGLENGKSYILPLTIKNVEGNKMDVVERSKTLFVQINQPLIVSAVDLTDRRYFLVDFPNITNSTQYDLANLTEFTVEARVRVPKFLTSNWCNTVIGIEEHFCFRFIQDDRLGQLQIGGINPVTSGTGAVAQDTWTHVAATLQNSTGRIFINGQLDTEKQGTNRAYVDLINGTRPFYIAYSVGTSRGLAGYISEVRVWAKALSGKELETNMCNVDPTSDGLIAYWKFDNETVTGTNTVNDLTGHGFDIKINNGVLKFIESVRCP